MIVYLKDASNQEAKQGFLALCCDADGEWIPITGTPVSSLDTAVNECIHDVRQQLDDLAELVAKRSALAVSNLDRLLDQPTQADSVCIYGQTCKIDDGALTLPPPLADMGPPWPAIDVTIEASLWQALQDAMQLKKLNYTAAVETIVSAILNEPLDLLVAVEANQPSMLGQLAELMVKVKARESAAPRPSHDNEGNDETSP